MNPGQPPAPARRGRVLPASEIDAVLFDLDGVVTNTASVHAAAWGTVFDAFLARWSRSHGVPFAAFTAADYLAYVDGRPRTEGIRAFTASRGISLPEGDPSDQPEADTVQSLSEHKNRDYLARIRRDGVDVYPSTVALIRRLRELGLKAGVVTASRNCEEILSTAGLDRLFDAKVDGKDRAIQGLRGKPAADTFIEGTRRLGVKPNRAAVVEDAVAGVAAGRAGGFRVVIGVDRANQAEALRENGADFVVSDLDEVEVVVDRPRADAAIHRDDIDVQQLDPLGRSKLQRRYFEYPTGQAPWVLRYEEFRPALESRRETLLALGNGYFVTRGAAAESAADGIHYPGTYLAGGYNRMSSVVAGQSVEHEDLVNLANWLPLTFRIDGGEWLDLQAVEILAYQQALDLRTGLYRRMVRVRDTNGRTTRIMERRLVHMRHKHLAGQHTLITAEDWSGKLTISLRLDARVSNAGVLRYRPFNGVHLRTVEAAAHGSEFMSIETAMTQAPLRVMQAARVRVVASAPESEVARDIEKEPDRIGQCIDVRITPGQAVGVEKIVALYTSRDHAIADGRTDARNAVERADTFDGLLRTQAVAWRRLWRRCDLDIADARGDDQGGVQRIVRLHIFHLLQTVSEHTLELDAGVPARGWHGEGYRGHIFWDELFVLPFLNVRTPGLTRAHLLYRYRRLPAARWAAGAAGFKGAMFPWQSGSDGREETDIWFLNPRSGNWIRDNTHLQRHVGAAIAYNVWRYYQASGDTEFLCDYGAELLIEIARFWASAARWNEARRRYDIRGVVGPDEFHDRYPGSDVPGLSNNAYTNVMAAWCLARALEILTILPRGRRCEISEALELRQSEFDRWDEISRRLHVPFHGDGVISQFEGYEALEEFDWTAYGRKYDNIMRLDLILEAEGDSPNRYKLSKQADVLMLFYLFSAEELRWILSRLGYGFDGAMIPRTIDYYLRRTSHGSTLSAIVHTWVLARCRRHRSWAFFEQALHSDIGDIQGGTTPEGIHLGAMAGTVDILQRCYTGLELCDGRLKFDPALPAELERLAFRMRYRRQSLAVEVTHTDITIASDPGDAEPIAVVVGDRNFQVRPGTRCATAIA